VLDDDVAREWLDGHFELVSIGVLPAAQRRGVGRALLDQIVHGLSHDRWLLMTTSHADDPARRMYAAAGWSVIGPGLQQDQVVMGRRGQGQTTSGL
jgi:ribosomal protein S18 acetylase RimI-like enzyme